MNLQEIKIQEFDYALPQDRIAVYPLKKRDESKLLVYQNGTIQHQIFKKLPKYLPSKALLVFNNTKVIHARLVFQRATGAYIEVFCLDPAAPETEINRAMAVKKSCRWHCLAGNAKRWKDDEILHLVTDQNGIAYKLNARLVSRQGKEAVVEFSWEPGETSFALILEIFGRIPLPPYLNRDAEEQDNATYQTVYARQDGAVAAPTAGLHFTPEVLKILQEQGFQEEYLTLHVSAGTFQPVQEEHVIEHPMHSEQMFISRQNLEHLLESDGPVIAVGTTSLRALESIYWLGMQLPGITLENPFFIPKLAPYEKGISKLPDFTDLASQLLEEMKRLELDELRGRTEIMIMPGYQFRVVKGLITNFHMPQSTLLMLIAAFIGDDWKSLYAEALANDYRFLSYGDSSLLMPE